MTTPVLHIVGYMRAWGVALLLSIVLAVSLLALFFPPLSHNVRKFYHRLASAGSWGYCLLTLLQAGLVVATVPLMLPNVALSNLYSWPIAFAISMMGFLLGITIIYTLFGWVKWEPRAILLPLYRSFLLHPYKSTLLVRFIPIPMGLKNYGLASCPIGYIVYLLCGCAEGIYVNALELMLAEQLWRVDSVKSIVVLVVTSAIGIASTGLLAYLARKALRNRQETAEPERSLVV